MKLIGMLDSPYVRRVAISLQRLGLPFEHEPLSVFRHVAAFGAINPVIKAPTLVCDDGVVLVDSTLILDYAETLAGPGRSLLPAELAGRRAALRTIGLALAACEKSVQLVYEGLRPPALRHPPWVERVTGQLHAALHALEAELDGAASGAPDRPGQAAITRAVAWRFAQCELPAVVSPQAYPRLAADSERAEQHPAFQAAPHGVGRYQAGRDGAAG